MKNKIFEIKPKILNAINKNKPVVALESTLISHGLPYPQNLIVVKKSIKEIENSGAVAAFIGIINGKIKVGLSENELKFFAKNKNITKISTHNILASLSKLKNGATTVASSIMIAKKAGIKYFATGGIGGVHLNAEKTFDISADLIELSNNEIVVVCSGAKSILDLKKTYESLETFGISRIGYKTDYVPGFWYRKTNYKVDLNIKNISEIKDLVNKRNILGKKESILIFNPVPMKDSIDKKLIDRWVNKSIKESKKMKISGKDLTPFLINSVNQLSRGLTLKANMSLIINNAKLAGKISSS